MQADVASRVRRVGRDIDLVFHFHPLKLGFDLARNDTRVPLLPPGILRAFQTTRCKARLDTSLQCTELTGHAFNTNDNGRPNAIAYSAPDSDSHVGG